jgi:predicted nucleic acid-binding protein
MLVKVFFDTNVLIHAVAEDDPRSAKAEDLLASGGVLSVQILNEFVSVARRKISMSWSDVTEALHAFQVLCPSPLPITIELHEAALKIAKKRVYNIYDALVVAAALEAGCATLYSEDLHDGLMIDGQLTIRNPFARSYGEKPSGSVFMLTETHFSSAHINQASCRGNPGQTERLLLFRRVAARLLEIRGQTTQARTQGMLAFES